MPLSCLLGWQHGLGKGVREATLLQSIVGAWGFRIQGLVHYYMGQISVPDIQAAAQVLMHNLRDGFQACQAEMWQGRGILGRERSSNSITRPENPQS